MKNLIFLPLLIFCISCVEDESATYKEMKSDQLMVDFFSDNELKDLAKIVDFFESQICLDKSQSKEQCYFDFHKDRINKAFSEYDSVEKPFDISINYKQQKLLYNNIDTTFLKEVWIHPMVGSKETNYKPVMVDYYNINIFGKYMLFLKSLRHNDQLFNDFYDVFYISNDISFGVQYSSFSKFELKEFEGIKRRLFFAIYYLTVNENINSSKYRKR